MSFFVQLIFVHGLFFKTETEDCLNLCKYVESKWDAIKLNDNLCLILRIIYEKANEIELYERLLISKLNEILSSSENMYVIIFYIFKINNLIIAKLIFIIV